MSGRKPKGPSMEGGCIAAKGEDASIIVGQEPCRASHFRPDGMHTWRGTSFGGGRGQRAVAGSDISLLCRLSWILRVLCSADR